MTSALRHVGFGVVDENGDPAQFAPVRPRVVRRSQPERKTRARKTAKRSEPPAAGRSEIDRTLEQRRIAQQRPGRAEADYAAAEAEREEAEHLLDAHQHRVADLEADLVRLNEQLEQTPAGTPGRTQTDRPLERAFNQAVRNAGAIKKRRDAEEQRLSTLGR